MSFRVQPRGLASFRDLHLSSRVQLVSKSSGYSVPRSIQCLAFSMVQHLFRAWLFPGSGSLAPFRGLTHFQDMSSFLSLDPSWSNFFLWSSLFPGSIAFPRSVWFLKGLQRDIFWLGFFHGSTLNSLGFRLKGFQLFIPIREVIRIFWGFPGVFYSDILPNNLSIIFAKIQRKQ
jgi:hypothetical protein